MAKGCLRPEFTHQLLESLLHGESIHLMSPHGQGRRRTLQDLRWIAPLSWEIIQVDMRDIRQASLSLVDELAKKAKVEEITSFHDFLYKLDKISIYHLIIIHNFDFLTDLSVISCLNEIEKYTYISLLCVSEQKAKDSALLARACMLPAVTSEQILAEIKRRDWPLEKEESLLLAAFLLQQDSPYSLLDEKPLSWFLNSVVKLKDERKGCTDV